jgi:hypothetical protein
MTVPGGIRSSLSIQRPRGHFGALGQRSRTGLCALGLLVRAVVMSYATFRYDTWDATSSGRSRSPCDALYGSGTTALTLEKTQIDRIGP